jgi:hypothetical protein
VERLVHERVALRNEAAGTVTYTAA